MVRRRQPVAVGAREVCQYLLLTEKGLPASPCWGRVISVPREVGTVCPRGSASFPTHLHKAKLAPNHNSPLPSC